MGFGAVIGVEGRMQGGQPQAKGCQEKRRKAKDLSPGQGA